MRSMCLHIPLVSDVFVLQTNVFTKGASGVLCVCRDGAELPVAFYSRQLKERESNYAATELEYLAVKDSVCHFEVFLHDKPFKRLEGLLKST